jgi:2-polyprenyl-6-methoxyphenol hydroxylase-like FAD-dependent oxidoreductase
MKTRAKIAIVGGSIAGLSLAWALQRRGVHAAVFERSSGLLRHQGAGVMLGGALVQSLELTNTRTVTRRYYLGTDGQVLWEQSVEKYAASWSDIYGVLRRNTADVMVYENCPVEGIDMDRLRLSSPRNGQEPFELIVGADGIGSLVRGYVDPDFAPHYLGYIALRGLVPRERLPGDMPVRVHDLFDNAMAKLLMNGEHATLYGLPGGDEPLNWMWYVNVPESRLARLLTDRHGHRHAWSLPPGALHAEIERELRGIAAMRLPAWMNALVAASETLFLQPIFSGMVERAVEAGVVLVGDAAHLSVPHVGAGVSLAVEDSFALAEVIANGGDDRKARLDAWAESRRATATPRLSLAIRLGESLQTKGKSWESWSPEIFDEWWTRVVADAPVDKSQ